MEQFTQAQIDALPEVPGIDPSYDVVTDATTGKSEMVRRPARFVVMRDQGWLWDAHGHQWAVGYVDGVLSKQRCL